MKIPATLTKITSTHNNLRTRVITGWFYKPPMIRCVFEFYGPPLESGDTRVISTTIIENLKEIELGKVEFKTRNSTYELQIGRVEDKVVGAPVC